MFDVLMTAYENLGTCCHLTKDDRMPMFPTEVYSEGAMLKLIVSMLLECPLGGNEVLNDIARAARLGWFSEGVLRPAFYNEGSTSADAVVGNICVSKGTEWGVGLTQKEDACLFVLEAKMGSPLSKGTKSTSSGDIEGFNQAARNIACIAGVACRNGISLESFDGRLYVLMPVVKMSGVQSVIDEAPDVIKRAMSRTAGTHLLREGSKDIVDRDKFERCVEMVAKKSRAVSWESVLDALPNYDEKNRVVEFYNKCKIANLDRKRLRM